MEKAKPISDLFNFGEQERFRLLKFAEQERVSGILHGLGTLLSLSAAGLLTIFSRARQDFWQATSFWIYGLSMVALYASSTVYHILQDVKWRQLFGILDQASIFVFIAGSYSPFTLVLGGRTGWVAFALIWALALAGCLALIFFTDLFRRFSVPIYAGLGWLCLLFLLPMLRLLPGQALGLLLLGGFCYTAGILFYFWDRFTHHHAIWHLFVMAGSVFHFLVILFWVLPYVALAK